jgi:hypothetical protein
VSQADPDAGLARLFIEKSKLILVLMMRDFKLLHGLVRLIVFMLVFLIIFSVIIGFAGDIIRQVGVPSWTGDILEGDGPGGVEGLTVELEADVYIGQAPLTVNVTPHVSNAEGEVKYKWYIDYQDEGQKPVSKEAGTFQWTFEDMNSNSIALRVEDDRGEIDPESIWFAIVDQFDENIQAMILANETEGEPPLDVAFQVVVYQGLGPYTYEWSFGDGTSSRARAHTFEADGEEEFRVTVVVTDRTGNQTPEQEINIQIRGDEDGGFDIPLTLLDFVYGFCVMVCVIMVPVAFTAAFRQELVKGTVRTLVCYPGPGQGRGRLSRDFLHGLPVHNRHDDHRGLRRPGADPVDGEDVVPASHDGIRCRDDLVPLDLQDDGAHGDPVLQVLQHRRRLLRGHLRAPHRHLALPRWRRTAKGLPGLDHRHQPRGAGDTHHPSGGPRLDIDQGVPQHLREGVRTAT